MSFGWRAAPADRRLLPEGRLAGPMPWVIAIMMFLTVLAAAGGLALDHAAAGLRANLSDRISIQIVEADPARRDAQARAVLGLLARFPEVREVRRLSDAEIAELLSPWLGSAALGQEVPVPALIDVDLSPAAHARLPALAAAVRRAAPAARIDDHAEFLAPLAGLVRSLRWLALALVLLMAAAAAASVVLAARGALNTHRATIDVLHLMGATDAQIARLFQRRIALDALFGGAVGFAGAIAVILLIGHQLGQVAAGLVGAIALPPSGWLLLVLLPLGGVALATLAARVTVRSALGRML